MSELSYSFDNDDDDWTPSPSAAVDTAKEVAPKVVTTDLLTRGNVLQVASRLVETFSGSRIDTAPVRLEGGADPDEDHPVAQMVKTVLAEAKRVRASDVHFMCRSNDMLIRFRIDGALTDALAIPLDMGAGVISRIKIMSNLNIVERRRPQDGQFSQIIDGAELDVRVSTVASVNGENCVLRILDKSRAALSLGQLGMPDHTYAKFAKLIHSPFGMVICAGPTGSGKTTTLYAAVGELVDPTVNIMTIEDPVENVFPGIVQLQTNDQAGFDFATGLRAILRQDPDILLVGEIRGQDTTRVAIQAAMTGHFVASSVHATDAVSALYRLLDMEIEAFLVASSVIGVVGQRLLRRICDNCRVTYELSDEEKDFHRVSEGPDLEEFWKGAGCDECSGTGFRGRIGVYELLVMTPEIRRAVIGWASQEEIRALAVKQGMRTMVHEAFSLVETGVTTVAEVLRSVYTS